MKPELRFTTDNNDWDVKRFKDACTSLRSGTLTQNQLIDNGKYPVVNGGVSDYGRFDDYNCEDAFTIASRGEAGHIRYNPGKFWAGGLCYPYKAIEDDTAFIAYELMYKEAEFKELYKIQTSIPAVNKADFQDYPISLPNLSTQHSIATLLSSLDEKIKKESEEIDKLKQIKAAMLTKMFPKDGANVPEIRFEGFTDPWEQRKLGEIAKTTIGEFVIKTKQDDNYPYPVFNGGSSHTGFYNEFNNEGNKILVSARGANAGFVNIIKTRYWAGNSCYSIDLLDKTEFDTDFIYQEMKRNQTRFTDNQQAANIPSVSKSDVEKIVIDVPGYAEQIKIANCFINLDNLITLHQRQLLGLTQIKKALLNKLLI